MPRISSQGALEDVAPTKVAGGLNGRPQIRRVAAPDTFGDSLDACGCSWTPVVAGGLNGRPQKEADVCYSWWVLSALILLERDCWVDRAALRQFILNAQDADEGGIADKPGFLVRRGRGFPGSPSPPPVQADCPPEPEGRSPAAWIGSAPTQSLISPASLTPPIRPGNEPDVFHTFFGIAGLSLLGTDGLPPIDAAHAMPVSVMTRLRSQQQHQSARGRMDDNGPRRK